MHDLLRIIIAQDQLNGLTVFERDRRIAQLGLRARKRNRLNCPSQSSSGLDTRCVTELVVRLEAICQNGMQRYTKLISRLLLHQLPAGRLIAQSFKRTD